MITKLVAKPDRWIGVGVLVCTWMLVPTAASEQSPEPLPFPVYVAGQLDEPVEIDGQLDDPSWRATSLGWGLSHSVEPNVLCPDATLFRIGYDAKGMYISLACFKRDVQQDLPEHIWKPQETDLMDMQAVPRYNRMRGITPPVNTADVLISHEGRTVTLHVAPPQAPTAKVHDSIGQRALELPEDIEFAYVNGPDDPMWTFETFLPWSVLGFEAPAPGADWALNVYRDIRFFSNWSFIAWMRKWSKAEYSRYDLVDRFGRIVFYPDPQSRASEIEAFASSLAKERGRVRVFCPDSFLTVLPDGRVARQYYAERLQSVHIYGQEILRDQTRCSCDLPYYPYFNQKAPSEEIVEAKKKLSRLGAMMAAPLIWDDPASGVALISHAIPEARQGLFVYKKERLYRGLPE